MYNIYALSPEPSAPSQIGDLLSVGSSPSRIGMYSPHPLAIYKWHLQIVHHLFYCLQVIMMLLGVVLLGLVAVSHQGKAKQFYWAILSEPTPESLVHYIFHS